MNTIKQITAGILLGSLSVACGKHAARQGMFQDSFDITYLRNMSDYPLKKGESGEDTNTQEGKCNNFNFRFAKIGQEFEKRAYGKALPIYVMQHHTVDNLPRTISTFLKITSPVSAHYVIDKDGKIYWLVGDTYRAYHAGLGSLSEGSKLNPGLAYGVLKNDMNSWSIGIENVNNGNEPYTEEQNKANIELCDYLVTQYPTLNPKLMLGHSDWAPGRKIDPNPYFPWDKFANAQDEPSWQQLEIRHNFGIFPRKKDLIIEQNPDIVVHYRESGAKLSETEQELVEKLRSYGYDISETKTYNDSVKRAILSFQLHHAGQDILGNDTLRKAWENVYAQKDAPVLYSFTTNHEKYLDDLLDQCSK